ncbi:hypothetical protein OH807_06245 [Kitasatospora sp. NBC_01560]|uniref:hypothetical protein n=1 Tax=Kitasatospora sp. NBC_01560 TaxID=2975965 RepID=UPI0038681331
MKAVPRPRTGEGAVVLSVLTLLGLEMITLVVLPVEDRPAVGGALFGASAAVLGVAGLLWHRLRRRHRAPAARSTEAGDEPTFTASALEGFPTDAVRPLLLGPDAVGLDRLHTAWILATHGHDAAWITHHLDLPSEATHLLVDAARHQGHGGAPAASPPQSPG